MAKRFDTEPPKSGQRRMVQRVRTDLFVALSLADGTKLPARVIDVSTGGMFLHCAAGPEYGQAVTVVARLKERDDWTLLPATVRWITREGCGVEFDALSEKNARALEEFMKVA